MQYKSPYLLAVACSLVVGAGAMPMLADDASAATQTAVTQEAVVEQTGSKAGEAADVKENAKDKKPSTSASPQAIAWLEKIDAAGKALKSLHGQLRYEVIQGALGDKQVRVGSLFYEAKKPAKFAVHFDRLLAGRRLLREDRWYIFDGRWMVEKMGNQKQFIKREMVDPKTLKDPNDPKDTDSTAKSDADKSEAPQANLLADGQGPFALPVTLQKDQVLRKYKVEVRKEPEGDDHKLTLRLVPHVAQRGEFTQIDLTYDTNNFLPVRVETLDETENETVVILSNVKVDQPIDPVVFDTTAPAKADGWTIELKPWGE